MKDQQSTFLSNFSRVLGAVNLSQSSSNRFDALRELVANKLGLDADDIYIAGASTRASNLPIRLRQGRARDRHFVLGLGVLGTNERQGGVAAIINTSESRNYDLIGLVMRDNEDWVITDLAVMGSEQVADQLLALFPGCERHDVEVEDPNEEPKPGDVLVSATRFPTAADLEDFTFDASVDSLLDLFIDHAEKSGAEIDRTTAADLLAVALGSQLILFAGPSGTGKSTAATLLARFFCPERSWAAVGARRQWIGPEDFVGYYSVMAETYVATPEAFELMDLATAAIVLDGDQSMVPPFLVIEEANLSPMEGYLAPVVHGLSGLSTKQVSWPLHGQADAVVPAGGDPIPGELVLGPFPRFLGTINVDATAMAPARKVTARAAVVLLEPEDSLTPETIANLVKLATGSDQAPIDQGGLGHIGDPLDALRATDEVEVLTNGLTQAIAKLGTARNVVSKRDVLRCLVYMAWYRAITGRSSQTLVLAAENSLLHYILPTLPVETFGAVLRTLGDAALEPRAAADKLGGLLGPRVERLLLSVAHDIAGAVDFWTSLS